MSLTEAERPPNVSAPSDGLEARPASREFSLPSHHSMQSIVTNTDSSTKSWHKELLFGLFLPSDDTELARLATMAQTPKLSEMANNKAETRKRTHSSLSWHEESCDPSRLSLVSDSLQSASGYKSNHASMASSEQPRRNSTNNPSTRNTPRRHRNLQGRNADDDIHDIELIVKDKFQKSLQGKQALAKRSPEKGLMPKYEPFSLEYNEVSMSGIATWAVQNEEKSPAVQHVLVPMILFQQCGICRKWGHYEIDCNQVPSADNEMIELCQQVQMQKRQQEAQLKPNACDGNIACGFCQIALYGEPNLQCHGCSSSFHTSCILATTTSTRDVSTDVWFCESCEDSLSDVSSIVELEGCEGFVIEQRKRQRLDYNKTGNLDDEWNATIGVRCLPKNKIGAVRTTEASQQGPPNKMPPQETLVVTDAGLVPGDLCWTRRDCSDSKPLSENDDWWPSVVKFTQSSTFGSGQSFVVKRLATMTTKAKTSIVLPFFQNFDRLGYRRILGNHPLRVAWDASRFGNALNLAVQESGNTYLQQFLKEAQESSRHVQRTEESSLTQTNSYRDNQPQCWDEAEEAVQDGFLIRSKEVSSRHLISSAETTERQLVGSTVAWSSNDPGTVAGKGDASMHVGTVLAINLGDETALVEFIRDWEDSLPEAVVDKDTFVVNSCLMGSSAWIQMRNLRVLSSGASLHLQHEFSNEVAPALMGEANNRCQHENEPADTLSHPATRSHARTTRPSRGYTHTSNIFDSERQDASGLCGDHSISQTSKQAKKVRKETKSDRDTGRYKAWQTVDTNDIPPVHRMSFLLRQCFIDERDKSQSEAAVRTRFKRSFKPTDITFDKNTKEWKLSAHSTVHTKPVDRESGNDDDEKMVASVADGEIFSVPQSSENIDMESSQVDPKDVPSDEETAPTPTKGRLLLKSVREKAWKRVDPKDEPSLRWMHVLLKQRFDDENERSQKDKALRTRFIRNFHPEDIAYDDETEEWKLSAESTMRDKASDTESCNDDDAKVAKAEDNVVAAPQSTKDESDDVDMRPSPMDPIEDSHEEETQPSKIQRQLREQAWRGVDKKAIPPVHCMCALLNQCCDDEHERSKKDKAVTYRFKKTFSPGDVIYDEKTEEWKLARDSTVRIQPSEIEPIDDGVAESAAADAFAVDPLENIDMKDAGGTATFELSNANDAKPAAAVAGIKSSALPPSPTPEDEAKDLNLSAAGPIKIVRDDEVYPNPGERSETLPRDKGSAKDLREKAWRRVDASDIPPSQVMSALLFQCFDDESEKTQNLKAIKSRFRRWISHTDVIYNEKKKKWMISPDSSLLPKTDGNKRSTTVIEGFRPLRLVKRKDANRAVTGAIGKALPPSPLGSPQDQAVDLKTNPTERAKSRRKWDKPKSQSEDQNEAKSHAQKPEENYPDKESEETDHEAPVEIEERQPLPEEVEALAAEGLYALEDILDDRVVVVKGKSSRSEYLIKWKGYGMDECTWEPKSSVMDPCLVERYEVNKIHDKLSRLEPKEQDARTMLIIRALKNGLPQLQTLLDQGLPRGEKRPKVTRRLCPFCRKPCGSNISPFKSHLRTHESESKNFDLLLEAALVIREEWLDP